MDIKTFPGTNIEVNLAKKGAAKRIIDPMFLTGGLMLSQVSGVTGLEPHMIQNWVKRGFLTAPVNKKYSKNQFCRILIINFLRDSLQIDKITGLIGYINGKLSEDSDDIIDDSDLYYYFVDIISKIGFDIERVELIINEKLYDYTEKHRGDKERLINVLKAMTIFYMSAQMKSLAEVMLMNNFEEVVR